MGAQRLLNILNNLPQIMSFTSTSSPFSLFPPQVAYRSVVLLERMSSSAPSHRAISLPVFTHLSQAASEDLGSSVTERHSCKGLGDS